jgi:predicted dehydrogenase
MIGAGFFAQYQAEAWNRLPDVQITAIADIERERAAQFAARWNIANVYDDVDAMLRRERPDFVDIVTRPTTHPALTELAATHGAHVICQKPMAETWEECAAMSAICRARNVRLIIHENWRWQSWYREIKRLLDTNLFGSLFQLGFRLRNGDGRGAAPYPAQPYFSEMPRLLLYETGVHFIDTFRYLAGEIASLYCQTQRVNPLIAGEDSALVLMNFVSGARGLLNANRIAGKMPPATAFGTLLLEGERASLRMDDEGELFITAYGAAEQHHAYAKPTHGYKGDSVFMLQQHIVECLKSGKPCESEASDYFSTVKALFACYESAATNQVITL